MTEKNEKTQYLASNATTTIKTGPGYTGRLVVHTVGSGGAVILYDNTEGSGTIVYSWATADGKLSVTLDARFSTGLTAVVTGGAIGFVTYA